MTFACQIFDQDDFARFYFARFAVAGRDFHTGIQVDDVLTAGGGMPIEVVIAGRLSKYDSCWPACGLSIC